MNDQTKTAKPTIAAQRDIALAVLVLVNDTQLTSDEAIDELVERHVITKTAGDDYRKRYWDVARFVRPTVDAINAEAWA